MVRTVAVRMGGKQIPDVNRVYHRAERMPDNRPEPFPELAVPSCLSKGRRAGEGCVMGGNAGAIRHFDKLNAGKLTSAGSAQAMTAPGSRAINSRNSIDSFWE